MLHYSWLLSVVLCIFVNVHVAKRSVCECVDAHKEIQK